MNYSRFIVLLVIVLSLCVLTAPQASVASLTQIPDRMVILNVRVVNAAGSAVHDVAQGAFQVPRRAAQLARNEEGRRGFRRPPAPQPRRSRPRRPPLAVHALRRRLVRHPLAEGVRRPQRRPARADHLPGGAGARRLAPAHQPARAQHGRPGASSRTAPRSRSGATSNRSSRPRRSGARATASPARAPTSRRSRRAPCSTATRT